MAPDAVNAHRALVGRILLMGAVVLAVIGILCWTGVLPVAPGARRVLSLAFGIAAAADAAAGVFFLRMTRDPRP